MRFIPELTTERVGPAPVDLKRGEGPAERGEFARDRTAAGAELDDRAARRGRQRDEPFDDAAIDQEVLAEFVPAAERRRGE
ncbi:hypothetical protein JOE59_003507 [Agromyces cerinus]|nr:hypothetical protein [Agromyces cerinus]